MKTQSNNLPPENSVEASPWRLATAACPPFFQASDLAKCELNADEVAFFKAESKRELFRDEQTDAILEAYIKPDGSILVMGLLF